MTDSEQTLFTAVNNYFKGVMNGKTNLPTKVWKSEYADLTAKRKMLNKRYAALKDEVKEAEQMRKNVYSMLRQEQQQPGKRI
ncbi:MAG: hypothetical protein VB111_05670 [Clostridiaceae bacterium]|nr:hypothetical protein [Clostridiaceae bacterium]